MRLALLVNERVLHSYLSPGYQFSAVKEVRLTEVAQLDPPQAASHEDDEGRHYSFADLLTQVAVLWVRTAPHLHSGIVVCKSSARPQRIRSLPSLSPSLSWRSPQPGRWRALVERGGRLCCSPKAQFFQSYLLMA